jgi:hypothetical protein
MILFVDADLTLLVNLALLIGEGTCLFKKDSALKNWGKGNDDALDRVLVLVFRDFDEIQEFLAGFHLIENKPRTLFVDLGIVKRKEVIWVVGLLASLQQVCPVKVFCIGKGFGNHAEIWNGLGRFFDQVFIAHHSSLAEIKSEKGAVSMNLVGDLMQNLAKIG